MFRLLFQIAVRNFVSHFSKEFSLPLCITFWTKQLKKLRQFSVEFTFFVPFEKKLAQRKGFNQMILIVLVILVDGIDQVIEKQIVIP